MEQVDILRKLFDEKIIVIVNNFLDNPDKKFSLTQISSLSKISVSTTFRILDKLVTQDIIEQVLVGKSKFYKLKQSDKTLALNRVLRRDEHIQEFIERLKRDFRIKKIILESRTKHGAKLIIVGDFLSENKVNSLVEDIKNKYDFRIQFVEISEKQFLEMKKIGLYSLETKIIWERD